MRINSCTLTGSCYSICKNPSWVLVKQMQHVEGVWGQNTRMYLLACMQGQEIVLVLGFGFIKLQNKVQRSDQGNCMHYLDTHPIRQLFSFVLSHLVPGIGDKHRRHSYVACMIRQMLEGFNSLRKYLLAANNNTVYIEQKTKIGLKLKGEKEQRTS